MMSHLDFLAFWEMIEFEKIFVALRSESYIRYINSSF